MIQLSLDESKIITFALVPYTPDATVIEMAAAQPDDQRKAGEYDKVKLLPQLQILNRKDLSVIATSVLTVDELMALLLLGKSIGASLKNIEDVVDKHYDQYREFVLRASAAAAAKGGP